MIEKRVARAIYSLLGLLGLANRHHRIFVVIDLGKALGRVPSCLRVTLDGYYRLCKKVR